MNTSNLTRWLVTCILFTLFGVWGGYQLTPTDTPATTPELPPLSDMAHRYLSEHYINSDYRQVVSYVAYNCLGMRCEEWGIHPFRVSLTIYIRCYLDTRVCVGTNEQ